MLTDNITPEEVTMLSLTYPLDKDRPLALQLYGHNVYWEDVNGNQNILQWITQAVEQVPECFTCFYGEISRNIYDEIKQGYQIFIGDIFLIYFDVIHKDQLFIDYAAREKSERKEAWRTCLGTVLMHVGSEKCS